MIVHTRIFLVISLITELFCNISKLQASADQSELNTEEFRIIGAFSLEVMPDIQENLRAPELRESHNLPTDPALPLSEEQQDRLYLIQYTMLFDACKTEFPDYSDGVITAAILGISAADDPKDNPFDAEHPAPRVDDAVLGTCAEYIRLNYDQLKAAVIEEGLYKRANTQVKRQTIGSELLSTHILNNLIDEFSFEPELASEIFLYLQSVNHWRPRDHISALSSEDEDASGEHNFSVPDVRRAFQSDLSAELTRAKWIRGGIMFTSFLGMVFMAGARKS